MLIFAFVGIEYGTLWVFLSCNQAPEIAKFLAALSGAVALLLIGVWMADLCWACLDDPQIENMHGRQALPGAFPLARGHAWPTSDGRSSVAVAGLTLSPSRDVATPHLVVRSPLLSILA